MSIRFAARTPDLHRTIERARRAYRRELLDAARVGTDRASREGQKATRQRIKEVGLKRLANAVGQTSALKKRQREPGRRPYGVIFARGGPDSRAGGALDIYSSGGAIRPKNGKWLWIPTKAAAKRYGGRKATPELYRRGGSPLGPLQFFVLSPAKAIAYVEKVAISVKTGRARPLPKRRSRASIAQARVVLFTGIRSTRRSRRFDHKAIMARQSRQTPRYIGEALSARRRADPGR